MPTTLPYAVPPANIVNKPTVDPPVYSASWAVVVDRPLRVLGYAVAAQLVGTAGIFAVML